jgi:hypothetical protein
MQMHAGLLFSVAEKFASGIRSPWIGIGTGTAELPSLDFGQSASWCCIDRYLYEDLGNSRPAMQAIYAILNLYAIESDNDDDNAQSSHMR